MALADLFTDIADAIREKDKTTGTIVANNFPARIRSIQTGINTAFATITFNETSGYWNGMEIYCTVLNSEGTGLTQIIVGGGFSKPFTLSNILIGSIIYWHDYNVGITGANITENCARRANNMAGSGGLIVLGDGTITFRE